MLRTETVEKSTVRLLRLLQEDSFLLDFSLVGGTSLALRLGHRMSVDLDLFSNHDFDVQRLKKHLEEQYGFRSSFEAANTLKGDIDGVAIDCISYKYKNLRPDDIIEGLRLKSLPDVIAMKLSAITDSGTRIKDFIDIAFLSTKFSLSEMLNFYATKYPNSNPMSPLRALNYYEDIIDEPVRMLSGNHSFESIKSRLEDMARHTNRKYLVFPLTDAKASLIKSFSKSSHLYTINNPRGYFFSTLAEHPDYIDDDDFPRIWSSICLEPVITVNGTQIVKATSAEDDKINIVDTSTGKQLLPYDVDGISAMLNGFAILKNDGKYNYSSLSPASSGKGAFLLPDWCEQASHFDDSGTASIIYNGSAFTIDNTGKVSDYVRHSQEKDEAQTTIPLR